MKTQIKSILIPTDFSETSESTLAVGIAIAKRHKAKVTLLHVIDSFTSFQPAELMFPGMTLPDLKSVMENKLNNLSSAIERESGVQIKGKVLAGQPSEQICRLAYNKQLSMIVLGTHGISGKRKLFIGSDAYRVVKNAPCPVLTVPGTWTSINFKKVLFPIRLIPGALDKYFYSRPIIEKNKSELFLLGLTDMKDYRKTKELILLIGRLKHQLHNDNVKFQTSYCPEEDFAAALEKTVSEHNADLIILTANIDIDWKSFFVGPFVQRVINHAEVPVLSIKPSDNKEGLVQPLYLAEEWGRSQKFPASC
jgi:nucleotide-binding universal stress UspA family protein